MHMIIKLLTTYSKEKTNWATRGKGQRDKDKSDNRIFIGNNVRWQWNNIFKVLKLKKEYKEFFAQWYILHCEIKILSDLKKPKNIHYQQTCMTRNVKGSSSRRRKIILDVFRQGYWSGLPFPFLGNRPDRDQTRVSHTVGRLFTVWATSEAHTKCYPGSM